MDPTIVNAAALAYRQSVDFGRIGESIFRMQEKSMIDPQGLDQIACELLTRMHEPALTDELLMHALNMFRNGLYDSGRDLPELWKELGAKTCERILGANTLSPKAIAPILPSLVALQVRDLDVVSKIGRALRDYNVSSSDAIDASFSYLDGCVGCGYRDVGLYSWHANMAMEQADWDNPEKVILICWSLAYAERRIARSYFECVLLRITNGATVSNLSLRRLHQLSKLLQAELPAHICRKVSAHLEDFSVNRYVQAAWQLCAYDPVRALEILRMQDLVGERERLWRISLNRIDQIYLANEQQPPDALGLVIGRSRFMQFPPDTRTKFEVEGHDILRKLRIRFIPEAPVEGFTVDALTSLGVKDPIMEFDGPAHFVIDRHSGKCFQRGYDELKNDVLGAYGHTVFRMSHKLPRKNRKAFIREVLV